MTRQQRKTLEEEAEKAAAASKETETRQKQDQESDITVLQTEQVDLTIPSSQQVDLTVQPSQATPAVPLNPFFLARPRGSRLSVPQANTVPDPCRENVLANSVRQPLGPMLAPLHVQQLDASHTCTGTEARQGAISLSELLHLSEDASSCLEQSTNSIHWHTSSVSAAVAVARGGLNVPLPLSDSENQPKDMCVETSDGKSDTLLHHLALYLAQETASRHEDSEVGLQLLEFEYCFLMLFLIMLISKFDNDDDEDA